MTPEACERRWGSTGQIVCFHFPSLVRLQRIKRVLCHLGIHMQIQGLHRRWLSSFSDPSSHLEHMKSGSLATTASELRYTRISMRSLPVSNCLYASCHLPAVPHAFSLRLLQWLVADLITKNTNICTLRPSCPR